MSVMLLVLVTGNFQGCFEMPLIIVADVMSEAIEEDFDPKVESFRRGSCRSSKTYNSLVVHFKYKNTTVQATN